MRSLEAEEVWQQEREAGLAAWGSWLGSLEPLATTTMRERKQHHMIVTALLLNTVSISYSNTLTLSAVYWCAIFRIAQLLHTGKMAEGGAGRGTATATVVGGGEGGGGGGGDLERETWELFSNWVCCVCIVTFDLELGQALEVNMQLAYLHSSEYLQGGMMGLRRTLMT